MFTLREKIIRAVVVATMRVVSAQQNDKVKEAVMMLMVEIVREIDKAFDVDKYNNINDRWEDDGK